ncbi:MAG: helix-turn-helix domain-containing protein [Candidatus Woesearchaeota archaeon]
MDIKNTLKDIGLSEGEAETYLALLKLGSVAASKIKEETGLHRTTIYDFLEKLVNKGLANFVIVENVKQYKAVHPQKLIEYLKEKEENVSEMMPEILKLMTTEKTTLEVEVHKGNEGFKFLLNDLLAVRQEYVGFGIDESMFQHRFPVLMEQYFNKEEKLGIKNRLLTSENAMYTYKRKHIQYRYVPSEFFGPTPTVVYGNRVAILIWEPFTLIVIKNQGLADSYRGHFEMLWKTAKKRQQ